VAVESAMVTRALLPFGALFPFGSFFNGAVGEMVRGLLDEGGRGGETALEVLRLDELDDEEKLKVDLRKSLN
jgi:hypothetical protein